MIILPGHNQGAFQLLRQNNVDSVYFVGGQMGYAGIPVYMPPTQPGDLLVHFNTANDGGAGAPASFVDPNFTLIGTQAGVIHRQTASYRVCTGAEAGNLVQSISDFFIRQMLLQFRPRANARISGVTVAGFVGTISSGNPTAQVITSSGGTPPLIALGWYEDLDGVGGISAISFSPSNDVFYGPDFGMVSAAKTYARGETPANVTIDMDDFGTNNALIGFYLQLS